MTTTANRKAIDRIRRENKRSDRQRQAQSLFDDALPEPVCAIDDDRLRLIFTCCHPALAMGGQVALATVQRLKDKLAGYHAYHVTRAEMLRRLGCSQKARAAYDKAIELTGNTAETAYLMRRRDQLDFT